MKQHLCIFFLLLTTISFSQDESTNSLYVRIRACEPSIGFEKKLSDKFGLAAEVGYRFRFTKEAYIPYGFIEVPVLAYRMNRAYSGFSTRPIILNFHGNDRITHRISTSYRYLLVDKIIDDSGKFKGSNSNEYAEYAEQKHQIGLSYLFDMRFKRLPILSWYFEMGANFNMFERQYSVEGTYTGQIPSNKVSSGRYFGVMWHFGLKLDLVKW